MITRRPELPGDVIENLRRSEGFVRSLKAFASTLGLSDDTLRRLERVKWGTTKDEWDRAVDQNDLTIFVTAEYITEGDDWWMRFKRAFVWQNLVLQYGEAVYDPQAVLGQLLEPIREAHVISLVEEVAARRVRASTRGGRSGAPGDRQDLVDRVCGEVLFRLATTGLVAGTSCPSGSDGRIVPESEPTRGPEATTSAAYLRTVQLVKDWAEAELREALGGPGVSD